MACYLRAAPTLVYISAPFDTTTIFCICTFHSHHLAIYWQTLSGRGIGRKWEGRAHVSGLLFFLFLVLFASFETSLHLRTTNSETCFTFPFSKKQLILHYVFSPPSYKSSSTWIHLNDIGRRKKENPKRYFGCKYYCKQFFDIQQSSGVCLVSPTSSLLLHSTHSSAHCFCWLTAAMTASADVVATHTHTPVQGRGFHTQLRWQVARDFQSSSLPEH